MKKFLLLLLCLAIFPAPGRSFDPFSVPEEATPSGSGEVVTIGVTTVAPVGLELALKWQRVNECLQPERKLYAGSMLGFWRIKLQAKLKAEGPTDANLAECEKFRLALPPPKP